MKSLKQQLRENGNIYRDDSDEPQSIPINLALEIFKKWFEQRLLTMLTEINYWSQNIPVGNCPLSNTCQQVISTELVEIIIKRVTKELLEEI